MNQNQRKYVFERIDILVAVKNEKVKQKHKIKYQVLTCQEAAELIRSGKVKVKTKYDNDDRKYGENRNMSDFFDFSKYHKPKKYGEPEYDTKAIDKVMEPIEAEARRIKDQAMLGDAKELMGMIAAFETFISK